MLEASSAPEFWQTFNSEPDPRRAFREVFERELPAFAHALLAMKIPQKIQGRRYGVATSIPGEAAQTLFEGELEHHLLLLRQGGAFQGSSVVGKRRRRREDVPTP